MNFTVSPPKSPIATAATDFAIAKSHPRPLAVIRNIGGSIMGDESQKAITAAKGVPIASNAAMNGTTSHEQNGISPPTRDARIIMRYSLPWKAFPTTLSAPVARK